MTRNTDSDRKVRGAKIRASRNEKRDAGDRRTTTPSDDGEGRDGPGEALADAGAFEQEAFVETDAVRALRDRIERWLAADRPVHLVGPTGCGKTAMAMYVARERDRPVVFVNGDADLTTADLVGEYAELERESVRDRYVHNVMKSRDVVRDRWVDNPLTVAAREGATFVYNEFARTDPAANNVLLSVFEEGVLELPGRRGPERYVEVHPEFRAVLTSNPVEYAGVHTPQDALLDRLVAIHMDFYDRETELAIVTANVDIDETTATRVVDLLRAVRESDELDVTVATRAMVIAAEGLAVAPEVTEKRLVGVCTDALASKVPGREGLADLRAALERAV